MTPVTFPEVTATLGAPADMPDCMPLPIARVTFDDGSPAIVSCWELSENEIAILIRTRRIWVSTCGHTLAPFALLTVAPFAADRAKTN